MKQHPAFRISSALLALLVLVSTVSFTIEKHYCGDHLVDVGLFGDAEKCGMEKMDDMVVKTMSKSCCSDTVEHLEGQDELKISMIDELTFENLSLHTIVQGFSVFFVEFLSEKQIPFEFYDPPRLVHDILTLDSVWLI